MYKKKEQKSSSSAGAPLWMTTYGDMVTLLLTFFVLLFTFSEVKKEKLEAVAASLRGALGGMPSVLHRGRTPDDTGYSVADPIPKEYQEIQEAIDKLVAEGGFMDQVEIFMEERGMILSFKEKLFFNIGSADIKPEAQELLLKVGKVLSLDAHFIRVEGHTCDLPIRTSKFPSNWELSTTRATNVARFFIDRAGIDPRRMGATGYAEFRPRVPNLSEENRMLNRRVDILLLWSKSI